MADISLSLIRRCKARDPEAFNLLLARHEAYLYRLCYKYLGRKEDALDVVQEIFLRVFRNIEKYDENREFLPWLKRIAINTCLNYRRDTGKGKTLSLDFEVDEGIALHTVLPSQTDIAEEVIALTEQEKIRECLQLLPPGVSLILTMHYLEGATCQEMSLLLEQPVGTIKNSLFRARALLKKVFQEQGLLEV